MSREIERKWLWNPQISFYHFVEDNKLEHVDISDYYFNDLCRLRIVDGIWYITIKSKGNLIREEFEFLVDKEFDIDFLPTPLLRKRRYFFQSEDGYVYEINEFRDIMTEQGKLITVEVEIPSPSLVLTPPLFCGQEITPYQEYYGNNLYKLVKDAQERQLKRGKSLADIIPFRKKA